MFRRPIAERPDWQQRAHEFGFHFHTMYGERYWDESAYYQFSLQQIERDLETPTEDIHAMCLEVVDKVVNDEELLRRFAIPASQWEVVRHSWLQREPSLYSRLDFAYDGQSPAKLYENNADTPTSLYETGFWQWLWLEDQADKGLLPRQADQFNSLQEKLVQRFRQLLELQRQQDASPILHVSCCKDTAEDRGTVQYLQDCASEAGIDTRFVFIEDVGRDAEGRLTDLDDHIIEWWFKLYPWEFMVREPYAPLIADSGVRFLEPAWKSVLSNKALLPLLWQMFPNHPNLLPAYFEDQLEQVPNDTALVKKPIYSREGANISLLSERGETEFSSGPYGEEGFVYQQAHMLPKFGPFHTLIGSWLINDQAAGISIREDNGPITQDLSRFLPHIILG
ncbi:hypothetical protein CHH28_03410 [Bacterioplanes sanyensis]|uniref:Glutathionylspermidine synthase pre-ATP-grasp-like domain-containing protein n=1 Tax=Bacterioplanes sanyensis TaxID=1249553 RepID=A0A222FGC0_9GAMM|nr:glutathionylspermidine synthase family protein [Bacterioplanes sanyensis]ASP37779.1 hypothetical protein CHH28_03410 [Bacterioplanes sanyensis]